MVKLIYAFRRKRGLPRDAFEQYWRDTHAPLGARIPGLLRAVQVSRRDPSDLPQASFDGIVELWFEDEGALALARASREWQESTADEVNFLDASSSAFLVGVERVIHESPRFAELRARDGAADG